MKRAIFLDRDGVINKYPGDFEYVKSWSEFQFLPQVKPALKKLNQGGFELFIISNQAGVSKNLFSQKELDLITANMLKELDCAGIHISHVYYCTHQQEDNCNCRKPKTGLINLAIAQIKSKGSQINFKESFFIGDTIRDIQTGKSAGLRTILVFSGKEKPENRHEWQSPPDFTAQDLTEAVEIILK